MTWASNHDPSFEALSRVQGSLTVDLIMAPRAVFKTCMTVETAAAIKGRNQDEFSYFPVVDYRDSVLGLYNAERWFKMEAPDSPIGDDYQRLSEDIVIGADASIFDFMLRAETHPTNLVVSGNKIAGLVSLSDLQQLPVRAAIFALITSLEMAMANRIERHWHGEPDGWHKHLTDDGRKALVKKIKRAKNDNSYVGDVVLSEFSDKCKVLWEGNLLHNWIDGNPDILDRARLLRNDLAHGKQFAESPTRAAEACKLVREIMKIKKVLTI